MNPMTVHDESWYKHVSCVTACHIYVLCLGTFWLADWLAILTELSRQLQRHDGSDQKKRHVSVCEVLPRHQVSTIDRTLRGGNGEKGVKTCPAATVGRAKWGDMNDGADLWKQKKKWGWLSKLAFNSERGFYRPIVKVIGTESWQLRWESLSRGPFKLKAQLLGGFTRVTDALNCR